MNRSVILLIAVVLITPTRAGRADLFNGGCTNEPADWNSDGFVNFQDLTLLLADWGTEPRTDTCHDPRLHDYENLTALLHEWTGPGPAGSPEAALDTEAVPEPSTLLLALLATLGLSIYRRRRLRAF